MDPVSCEVLEELAVARRAFVADGQGRLRREAEPEYLFDFDPAGGVNFLSGLVPRVAAAARRAGYTVEVQDEAGTLIPAAPPAAGLHADRRRLAAALAGRRMGVVLARSDAERLAFMGLVLDLFAPGRVMVVTKTRDEAWEVCRALQAGRDEPVACYTRQFTRSDARIQVGTAGSLDLAGARVVVFMDATQVQHERVRPHLRILRRQRLFGLHDDRVDLSRREQLVLEGYLGPVIGRLGPEDETAADVVAIFADWRGGERPDRPLGLEWKRGSLWANPERNAAIARLAVALGGGDLAALWEFGLFLDDEPVARLRSDRRVAVLVESAEHGRALGRLLPGWSLLRAGEGRVERPAPAGADLLIATAMFARESGGLGAEVVIRADGMPWSLDVGLPAGRPGGAGERPVLLVDLADHQDRAARDATRRRWLDYCDRGWMTAGAPCPAPTEQTGSPA
jgi:hypothetical protein